MILASASRNLKLAQCKMQLVYNADFLASPSALRKLSASHSVVRKLCPKTCLGCITSQSESFFCIQRNSSTPKRMDNHIKMWLRCHYFINLFLNMYIPKPSCKTTLNVCATNSKNNLNQRVHSFYRFQITKVTINRHSFLRVSPTPSLLFHLWCLVSNELYSPANMYPWFRLFRVQVSENNTAGVGTST